MVDTGRRLEYLKSERDRLSGMSLDGMTLGECRDLMRELQSTEREIESLTQFVARTVPGAPMREKPVRRHVKVLSEENLGRNVMIILAAGLCLLALCLFAWAFWPVIGNITKFSVIGAAGVLICGFSVCRALRLRGSGMTRLWTGVSALGSCVVFLDLIAGHAAWSLYPDSALLVLMDVWFVVNFWIGVLVGAPVFHAIVYIGGVLAVGMACTRPSGAIVTGLLLFMVFGCGAYFCHKSESRVLAWFYSVSCWVACGIAGAAFYGSGAVGLSLVTVLITAFVLVSIRRMAPGGRAGIIISALLAFVGGFITVLCAACFLGSEWHHAVMLAGLVVVLVCGRGGTAGYYPGAAVLSVLVLGSVSAEASGYAGTVPAVTCLALLVLFSRLDLPDRWASMAAFYIASMLVCLTCGGADGPWSFVVVACVSMLFSLAGYYYLLRFGDAVFFHEPVDTFVMCVLAGLASCIPCCLDGYPGSVPFSIGLGCLWAYRLVLCPRYQDSGVTWACDITRRIVYAMFCVYCMTPASGLADQILRTECLLLTCVCSVLFAIREGGRLSALAAVFAVNLNLRLSVAAWGVSGVVLPVSLVGAALGAAFIGLGFFRQSRPIRQYGLACVIAHVLKIALIDIGAGTILERAGALFLGGMICLAVSFVYNKMAEKAKD